MRLDGKVTGVALDDIAYLSRPKMYWPRLFGSRLRISLLLGAILCVTTAKVISGNDENWMSYLFVWLIILLFVTLSVVTRRRARRKELSELNDRLPQWVTVDGNGIKITYADSLGSLVSWQSLSGWRERGSIIMLTLSNKKSVIILPLDSLSPMDRDILRGTLRSHLGDASRK